ncbi:glycosyltransferase [Rhodomicrobium lacus]|uniref:glycosyltransferase n=1 Tax=Rhodomicrobium lacus TaxID=2498452 RepID=UPI000F8DA49B|nr:glycosyltransferase [Rhodomicrobium lacus]
MSTVAAKLPGTEARSGPSGEGDARRVRTGAAATLRVLQSVPSYYPAFVYGGPIFSIHYLSEAVARLGLAVSVATTNANGATRLAVRTDQPVPFAPNYSVSYYDDTIIGRFSWAFTRNIWKHVRAADVVHLQDIYSTYAALTLAAAWLARKPVLMSPRGSLSVWALTAKRASVKRLWLKLLFLPLMRDRRRVAWHATSAAERDETLAVAPGARVRVIPNGMDCSAYDARPRPDRAEYARRFLPEGLVLEPGARVLACLGRLHNKKCFDIAIRAFALMRPSDGGKGHPGDVLLIAGGDDGARNDLEALVSELGLAARVIFVGEIKGDDKIAFLKGADLFLFPTHNENFGMSCLEALEAGTPVVSSRNAPWQELETSGAGFWVDNTPEAFARAAEELLARDPASLRTQARALAGRYDLTVIAAEMRDLYIELSEGGPSER